MLQIFQEFDIPKLSEIPMVNPKNDPELTGDLSKEDDSSNKNSIVSDIEYELSHLSDHIVDKAMLKEMIMTSLFRGNQITRNAVDAYNSGDIIITFNSEGSRLSRLVPYIIASDGKNYKAIIFGEKVLSKLPSEETNNLTAVMEAAYLSLLITKNPAMFFNNSGLMSSLCDIYATLATYPIENVKHIKGDNLNKIYIYVIAFFYSMFRDNVTEVSVPYAKIIKDKMDTIIVSQIFDEVAEKKPKSFYGLTKLMVKLNPISPDYANLPSHYRSMFFNSCGFSIFALEYIPYLFLVITSSINHASGINTTNFNKHINMRCKKVIVQLLNLIASYQ